MDSRQIWFEPSHASARTGKLVLATMRLSMLFALLAMVCAPARGNSLPALSHSFVFDTMLLAILVLASLVCCLVVVKPSTPAATSESRKALRGKTCEAAVQCNLMSRELAHQDSCPLEAIFFAPSSVRWHSRQTCKHLKAAAKISTLTPCQTCGTNMH